VALATQRTPSSGLHAPAQQAWSVFWQEPGQTRCVAGAPQIWHALAAHWTRFAAKLSARARVLDVGCGAGAVGRLLLEARNDVHVTGVDFARLPLTLRPGIELLPETAMEDLPFHDASFGAAVSQFAIEYSDVAASAREIARVLAPGAGVSMLVHHAGSDIVTANQRRLDALHSLLDDSVRSAFCGGEAGAFQALMAALRARHGQDELIAQITSALPSRLARPAPERAAIWKAVVEALAPERCLAESLRASCVAEAELAAWLEPLREVFRLGAPVVLRESGGQPIAWTVEGIRLG
jgi:SAM-dependent methyltransferase